MDPITHHQAVLAERDALAKALEAEQASKASIVAKSKDITRQFQQAKLLLVRLEADKQPWSAEEEWPQRKSHAFIRNTLRLVPPPQDKHKTKLSEEKAGREAAEVRSLEAIPCLHPNCSYSQAGRSRLRSPRRRWRRTSEPLKPPTAEAVAATADPPPPQEKFEGLAAISVFQIWDGYAVDENIGP